MKVDRLYTEGLLCPCGTLYWVSRPNKDNSVESAHDTYRLEAIDWTHQAGAALFVPCMIRRLGGETGATETTLTVELRNIGDSSQKQRTLHLLWSPDSMPTSSLGVPERVLTEWAACGVACVVVALYAGLTIRAVAANGDRFDYWVDDGAYEYGLEVSGTMGAALDTRHRAKVCQLCDNPYGVDGYVVVVSFTTRHVIMSFNRY